MDTEKKWYYKEGNEQKGPLLQNEILDLATKKQINPETMVWDGHGNWRMLKDTNLADIFEQEMQGSSNSDSINSIRIDNRYAWAVAAVPVFGALLELALHKELMLIYVSLNILLCVLDEKALTKSSQPAPKKWLALVIPVYLWQRATILNQKKYYFFAWCAAFALSIFITFVGIESELETIACTTVTDIIKSQLHGNAICQKVTIKDKVTSGFYKGTAFLDNGNELRISIEHRKNGQVYVTIPPQ